MRGFSDESGEQLIGQDIEPEAGNGGNLGIFGTTQFDPAGFAIQILKEQENIEILA